MAGDANVRVFINYRRNDAEWVADFLVEKLKERFGHVFIDTEGIPPGREFPEVIKRMLDNCTVMLALIGPQWLTVTDENGRRRIDDPEDWVVRELNTALQRDVLVIPVIINDGSMPRLEQLPENIAALTTRNASFLRARSSSRDVDALIAAIRDPTDGGWPLHREIEPLELNVAAPVRAVTLSPDNSKLATGSRGLLTMWNPQTGGKDWAEDVGRSSHHVTGAAFSSDGSTLAVSSESNVAQLRSVDDGKLVRQLPHQSALSAVAFSPDNTRIVTADRTSARVWETETALELLHIPHTGPVWAATFSPDGTTVATASDDGAVIWDAMTGVRKKRVDSHPHWVLSVAFAPGGSSVATGSSDKTARIWNLAANPRRLGIAETGALWTIASRLQELLVSAEMLQVKHRGQVNAVAFSPDGTRIATASDDGTARVWDAESGATQCTIIHKGAVSAVTFNIDGTRLVTGSSDGTIRISDVAPDT